MTALARHIGKAACAALVFCVVAVVWCAPAPVGAAEPGIIGWLEHYEIQPGDTFAEIARRQDLGYIELLAANPGVDPWLPAAGQTIVLPTAHVLPEAPKTGIVVNLADMRLYHFKEGQTPTSYPLGIGSALTETPAGSTSVTLKRERPTWIPPDSIRDENPDLPAAIGPGPHNPLGAYALNLDWTNYVIHGTNRPYGIGRRVSHGCIRLYPADIAALFTEVEVGTPVTIVDQPVKLGWFGGELYVEVHPTQREADMLERGEVLDQAPSPEVEALVLHHAGSAADRLDWHAVNRAAWERRGIPVQITGPSEFPLFG